MLFDWHTKLIILLIITKVNQGKFMVSHCTHCPYYENMCNHDLLHAKELTSEDIDAEICQPFKSSIRFKMLMFRKGIWNCALRRLNWVMGIVVQFICNVP
jgi:hypothetical protein